MEQIGIGQKILKGVKEFFILLFRGLVFTIGVVTFWVLLFRWDESVGFALGFVVFAFSIVIYWFFKDVYEKGKTKQKMVILIKKTGHSFFDAIKTVGSLILLVVALATIAGLIFGVVGWLSTLSVTALLIVIIIVLLLK